MLVKAKTLKNYKLSCLDGEIGKVKDLYFDDHHWVVRYLVVNGWGLVLGRQVLISPYTLTGVHKDENRISIDLTKKQIEASPSLEINQLVTHQFEHEYAKYYGMPIYWGGPYIWGTFHFIEHDREKWENTSTVDQIRDPHLRSTQHISGYDLHAVDGRVGRIEDFILDDEKWAIRYLIVDLPGKKILVSPKWIDHVSRSQSNVFVSFPHETLINSPAFEYKSLLTWEYEDALHHYYNRQGYLVDEQVENEHFDMT